MRLDRQPIWHSVSCLCHQCVAADSRWLQHQAVMLRYTDRPLFADE